jgi:hypothetical protein
MSQHELLHETIRNTDPEPPIGPTQNDSALHKKLAVLQATIRQEHQIQL